MNEATKEMLWHLHAKKIIGRKHVPENKILKYTIKWLSKKEKKEFEKGYRQLLSEKILLRTKKRTGKGTDWHISLNPKKMQEIEEILL
jgi:hypothetical protein